MRKIFVDTSAWMAIYNSEDLFHQQAKKVWQNALLRKSEIYTSNFVFDELMAVILNRSGKNKAVEIGSHLLANISEIEVESVIPEDEVGAWELFKSLGFPASYTDCTCFTVMKRLGIKKIFTYDKHFERMGLEVID